MIIFRSITYGIESNNHKPPFSIRTSNTSNQNIHFYTCKNKPKKSEYHIHTIEVDILLVLMNQTENTSGHITSAHNKPFNLFETEHFYIKDLTNKPISKFSQVDITTSRNPINISLKAKAEKNSNTDASPRLRFSWHGFL